MKRLLTSIIVCCLFACVPPIEPEPEFICDRLEICDDGEWLEFCFYDDDTGCRYQVGERSWRCQDMSCESSKCRDAYNNAEDFCVDEEPPPPTTTVPPTTTTTIRPPTAELYCETQYDMPCVSGYIEICVMTDGSRCGVKAVGRTFWCYDCDRIDYGGCDSAIYSALDVCFGLASLAQENEITAEDVQIRIEEIKSGL